MQVGLIRGGLTTFTGVGCVILSMVLIGIACSNGVFNHMQAGSMGSAIAFTATVAGVGGLGTIIYGMNRTQKAWQKYKNDVATQPIFLKGYR